MGWRRKEARRLEVIKSLHLGKLVRDYGSQGGDPRSKIERRQESDSLSKLGAEGNGPQALCRAP